MFYVYIHTCPDGRVYVGQTRKPLERWANGSGYNGNKAFSEAIDLFGWNNIRHEIVGSYSTETEAKIIEAVLIFYLESEDAEKGFNQSSIREKAINGYTSRRKAEGVALENSEPKQNILEKSGLSTTTCRKLIDAWIFDKRNRSILTDRLIDGENINEISRKYNLSVRQIKNIIAEGSTILAEHINI